MPFVADVGTRLPEASAVGNYQLFPLGAWMASNSRLSAKLRTIDIAMKIMPISRLSATVTCKSALGQARQAGSRQGRS